MPLGTDVGLGPGEVLLDGDPVPPKRGTPRQFSVHVYCGQTHQDTTWYEGRSQLRRHCVRWGPSSPLP